MPLSPPPRDGNGQVIPHDHQEILQEDTIVRRISAEFLVTDEKCPGGKRISTMAFQASSDGNGGMSVDLEKLIVEANIDPKAFLTTPKFFGSVCLFADQVRSQNLMIGFDPLTDNPYHGEVWGNFSKSRQRFLLKNSRWYVAIPNVWITITP